MTDNVQLARDLFAAVYRLDFDAAAALFTDDGYYHDMPLPSDPTDQISKLPARSLEK